MKRVVVELEGNLAFCGINKGYQSLDGSNGLFIETDPKSGLRVWCPEASIKEVYAIDVEE
ncbi:hypothetical protein [Alkaliphilus hydrothermalis]|uniref:Uncharacterized protein n=1 Tax=Alkaliphilus hydrothermalis TaxID=1482730 RepID=A0ABS2NRE2_9FIRM|nr:hypothetical protein [Alkaliphilus hydrothermalis]MBM7615505.1 hypothetical protein [Alkaliphilus hydrothermalis]